MASAHVIEVGGITAGIVVPDQGCFRFFASERACRALEGALFRTVRQATRAAGASLERQVRRRLSPRPSRPADPA